MKLRQIRNILDQFQRDTRYQFGRDRWITTSALVQILNTVHEFQDDIITISSFSPIYRFLCRRLGWMTGIGDTYFSKKGTKEDEPAEEMYEAIAEATVETEDVDDDLDDDDEDMDKST